MIEQIVLQDLVTFKSFIMSDTGYYLLNANHITSVIFSAIGTSDSIYKTYTQIGKTLAKKALDTRPVSIHAHVWGETIEILEQNKKALSSFINPLHDFSIILQNGRYIVFRPGSTIQYATSEDDDNELFCTFIINGTAYDPLFYDVDETIVDVRYTTNKFILPLSFSVADPFGFGEIVNASIINIINVGDIEVGCIFEISTSSGSVNASITNVETQEFIKINTEVVVGQNITIDTRTNLKSIKCLTAGVESNYYKWRDTGSSWIGLAPGDNVFAIGALSGAAALKFSVRYRNAYLTAVGSVTAAQIYSDSFYSWQHAPTLATMDNVMILSAPSLASI